MSCGVCVRACVSQAQATAATSQFFLGEATPAAPCRAALRKRTLLNAEGSRLHRRDGSLALADKIFSIMLFIARDLYVPFARVSSQHAGVNKTAAFRLVLT